MNKVGSIRTQLIEFEQRDTPLDKRYNNIYLNGANNLYPNEIEAAILASPTALKCSRTKAKFIAGREIKVNGSVVKYKDLKPLNNKGHNLYDYNENGSQSIANQGGVFVWVGFGFVGGKIKPTKWEVLDFAKCRISKEDDLDNEGRIYYGDFDGKKKVERWFYPFNPRESAIIEQVKKDAEKKDINIEDALPVHRGQVAFLNLNKNLVYPIAPIHAVYNDADSEYRIGTHTNREIRDGFLGKTMIITQGLDADGIIKVKKDVSEWLGAEGSSGMYHMHVDETDDISKVVELKQLQPQYNDKLFSDTVARLRANIISANEIPQILVDTNNGALFGTSGDAYEAAKVILDQITNSERQAWENFNAKLGLEFEIVPITHQEVAAQEIAEEIEQEIIEEKTIEELPVENKKANFFNRLQNYFNPKNKV